MIFNGVTSIEDPRIWFWLRRKKLTVSWRLKIFWQAIRTVEVKLRINCAIVERLNAKLQVDWSGFYCDLSKKQFIIYTRYIDSQMRTNIYRVYKPILLNSFLTRKTIIFFFRTDNCKVKQNKSMSLVTKINASDMERARSRDHCSTCMWDFTTTPYLSNYSG